MRHRALAIVLLMMVVTPAVAMAATQPSAKLKKSYEQAWYQVRTATPSSPGRNIVRQGMLSGGTATASDVSASLTVLRQEISDATIPPLQSSNHLSNQSSQPISTGGGWAIPQSVVQCESGGQNLPPNGASASGYYQIIDSTWQANGGSTAEAWQASKAEQDRVAAKIWSTQGASQWVCAS